MYQNSCAESDVLRSSLSVVFSFARDVECCHLQMSRDTALRKFSFVKNSDLQIRIDTSSQFKFDLESRSTIRSLKSLCRNPLRMNVVRDV